VHNTDFEGIELPEVIKYPIVFCSVIIAEVPTPTRDRKIKQLLKTKSIE